MALGWVVEEVVNHPQAGRAAFFPLWPEERAVGGPRGAHCPNARLGAGNSEISASRDLHLQSSGWLEGKCSGDLSKDVQADPRLKASWPSLLSQREGEARRGRWVTEPALLCLTVCV